MHTTSCACLRVGRGDSLSERQASGARLGSRVWRGMHLAGVILQLHTLTIPSAPCSIPLAVPLGRDTSEATTGVTRRDSPQMLLCGGDDIVEGEQNHDSCLWAQPSPPLAVIQRFQLHDRRLRYPARSHDADCYAVWIRLGLCFWFTYDSQRRPCRGKESAPGFWRFSPGSSACCKR
jgi:hypothetical protein